MDNEKEIFLMLPPLGRLGVSWSSATFRALLLLLVALGAAVAEPLGVLGFLGKSDAVPGRKR